MNKPTKPNITIPESFAANGVKADFDNNKILNGFDRIQPDVLAGDNLNKFIDDTYKASNYVLDLGDYIDEKVNKSGDTMTGSLAIERTANPDVVLRNKTIDIKNFTTPSSNINIGRFLVRDKNNVSVGDIISRITTTRNVETYMDAITYVDGVAKSSQIKCGVTDDGTPYTSAPTVATGDSSSNIVTTKWVNNMSAIIAGWAMPSGTSTSITIKESKSKYTAPANGFFQASKIKCDTTDWMALSCDGLSTEAKMGPNAAGNSLHIFIPCKKGASVQFEYNLTILGTLKFVYAEGAK